MALKTDTLNLIYNSLKMKGQKDADDFLDALPEEDYNALAERRDNERSIPDQIGQGLLKGAVPSYMEPQLDKPSPTTLEQGIEMGVETAKAVGEGVGVVAGGIAGSAAALKNPVAGVAEAAALGGRLGGAAGGVAGQPEIGASLGSLAGGAAGFVSPAARVVSGGMLGSGIGGELAQKYQNKAGIELGKAFGLDPTGAEEEQNKEGVPTFVTNALFRGVGEVGSKVLASSAAKEIARKSGAIGETVANKIYTKLGDSPIGKSAISLASKTRDVGKEMMDTASSAFDDVNDGFNRAFKKPPQEKLNFLKGEGPINSPIDLNKQVRALPDSQVKQDILKVTGADESTFQKLTKMTPDQDGYKKEYMLFRKKSLANTTAKEVEASRRYLDDGIKSERRDSGLKSSYVKVFSDINDNIIGKTEFGNPIAGYKAAKDATSVTGSSLGDSTFNEMMDTSIPLEDKATQLADYLFNSIPEGSVAKVAKLNKKDPNFTRNFLKSNIINTVKKSAKETSPFGMVEGEVSQDVARAAKEFGKNYGAGNAQIKNAGDIPFLADPSQYEKLLKLAKVDVSNVSSNKDIVNYNAQALNRAFREPKFIEKMKAAGVTEKRINDVLKMTNDAAESQVLYKGMEKFFQNPSLTTNVGKQIGRQLPMNLSAEQALKLSPKIKNSAAPVANFLKSAFF
jgi:hypothetical protein